ncbi:HNH endonuclease [Nostoc sp.]
MQRSRYPAQWNEIALQIKTEANWKCEQCGRECRRVGESLSEFIDRIVPKVHCTYSSDLLHEICTKPTRFVLTTAHLNHIPEDVTPSNLKALCSVCHCRYDLKALPHKKMLKREFHGQLNVFDDYANNQNS